MMHIRRIASVLLVVSLIFNFSVFAFAQEVTEYDTLEGPTCAMIPAEDHAEPMVYGNCATCSSITVLVCCGDDYYYGSATHSTLLYGDCDVYYYASRGVRFCSSCVKVCTVYSTHMCWQMHMKCSLKPLYKVCTMDLPSDYLPDGIIID